MDNDELQQEAPANAEAETTQIEPTTQLEAESATATEEPDAPAKITFSEEQQQIFNEAVGQKVKATRAAERKLQDVERQLEEANSKIPQAARPEVPAMPNPYEDDYESQMAVRDDAIRQAASFDGREAADLAQAQRNEQAANRQRQQAALDREQVFYGEADKQGIKKAELDVAAGVVGSYGLNPDLVNEIMKDEQGGAIVMHLAKNPLTIEQLNGASYLEVGNVYAEIRKSATVKKISAPSPSAPVVGGGVAKPSRGPAGATYE